VGWQLRGGFLGREREGEGQEGRGETEAHGASVSGLSSSFQFSVVGLQFFGVRGRFCIPARCGVRIGECRHAD
jgi:hypothetical protein